MEGVGAEEKASEEFPVEAIVDARGDPAHRWFQVKWEGDWGLINARGGT